MIVKPFLKWVGGKTQLLSTIESYFPIEIKENKKIDTYVEPFLGGGALFFYLSSNYNMNKVILNDLNKENINCYKVIKDNTTNFITQMDKIKKEYWNTNNKEEFYYKKREEYNLISIEQDSLYKAVLFLFLNKTCYNGIYRVNSKNKFNVPFGKKENIEFYDKENLCSVSESLQNTIFLSEDFTKTMEYIKGGELVYLDPPYRPITKTADFTSYTVDKFNNEDQLRLKTYIDTLTEKNSNVIMSNSYTNDDFFDNLYNGYLINKIEANRIIGGKKERRSSVLEIIITNIKGNEMRQQGKRIIKEFPDGISYYFDTGKIDNWCVYENEVPFKDRVLLTSIRKYCKEFNCFDRMYNDFKYIFNNTSKDINKKVLNAIDFRSKAYKEYKNDRFYVEKIFIQIYAGMIAEENKKYAVLGKKMKMIGLYQIFNTKMTPIEIADFNKGENSKEIAVYFNDFVLPTIIDEKEIVNKEPIIFNSIFDMI